MFMTASIPESIGRVVTLTRGRLRPGRFRQADDPRVVAVVAKSVEPPTVAQDQTWVDAALKDDFADLRSRSDPTPYSLRPMKTTRSRRRSGRRARGLGGDPSHALLARTRCAAISLRSRQTGGWEPRAGRPPRRRASDLSSPTNRVDAPARAVTNPRPQIKASKPNPHHRVHTLVSLCRARHRDTKVWSCGRVRLVLELRPPDRRSD
jgi:hypothetical protein